MSRTPRRSSCASRGRIAAIVTGFTCAGAAWVISAGGVLAPGPADLTSPLLGGTGATAAAIYTESKTWNPYVLWPAYPNWQPGTMDAGTPCSPYGLPAGARTTKRIIASGNLRTCLDYDPLKEPPANFVRPLPPMPIDGGDAKQNTNAITVTVGTVVLVISWPADWTNYDDVGGARPYAGQPCSDFALLKGESSTKHIQGININNDAVFRCVANTEPLYVD